MVERFRQTGRYRDEGLSLVELLVSMIVFGISLGMVFSAVIVLVDFRTLSGSERDVPRASSLIN